MVGASLRALVLSLVGMWTSDAKQPKMQFGAKKSTRVPPETMDNNEAQPAQGEHSEMRKMKTLLLTMQSSLSSLDSKMDTMTARLDLLTNRLERQAMRTSETEQRILQVEDTMEKKSEQLLQMDKLLKVIAHKNEGLEARSRRNKKRIVGVPESMDTGRMEQYVERLLITLFGEDAFSRMLVVERAQSALVARPLPGASARPIVTRLLN
ncbi:hypothetical protein NDU88_007191 [Pleurodeles waltl]|uniref:Uncharacterized protein n=1 Tax=Pleurodeles waltl TaxID=8319 RepID=A0AAV7N699_PLEWA|nr:hypothetical protein NDU88_007191 [Pleurodeles waltl]